MNELVEEGDIITSIVASPRAAGRFTIVVDDKSFATVSGDVIERLGIRVGMSIADLRPTIKSEDETLRTYDHALRMLAAQARSASDLERRLMRKGEAPKHVRKAIERLRAAGLLDDAVFARQFARSKLLGAGLASRRLRQELTRRGVERGVIEQSLADVVAEEGIDELAAATTLAERRLRSMEGLTLEVRKRRLYALLARRGYSHDVLTTVLQRVLR